MKNNPMKYQFEKILEEELNKYGSGKDWLGKSAYNASLQAIEKAVILENSKAVSALWVLKSQLDSVSDSDGILGAFIANCVNEALQKIELPQSPRKEKEGL